MGFRQKWHFLFFWQYYINYFCKSMPANCNFWIFLVIYVLDSGVSFGCYTLSNYFSWSSVCLRRYNIVFSLINGFYLWSPSCLSTFLYNIWHLLDNYYYFNLNCYLVFMTSAIRSFNRSSSLSGILLGIAINTLWLSISYLSADYISIFYFSSFLSNPVHEFSYSITYGMFYLILIISRSNMLTDYGWHSVYCSAKYYFLTLFSFIYSC